MTATHFGGDDEGRDPSVLRVSMTGLHKNDGTKDDDLPPIVKPPSALPEEDTTGKVVLSHREKNRILFNVAALSAAFMVQFTAFQGTANLQSSINAKDGLGTISLCSMYAGLVLSCTFLPTLIIKALSIKWTLCISMSCYALYIAAQFYPSYYTLVPAGVIVGFGAAPMWAAKATYLTVAGSVYAKITDQPIDAIVVRFFGFFFLAWQTSELWGNLVSSLVLSSGAHGGGGHHGNSTATAEALQLCGANFCVIGNPGNENLERPPDSEIYEISGIYLACVVVAVLMVVFLVDPLSRYGEKQRPTDPTAKVASLRELLSATLYQLKKPNQQLLIPITVFIGMEQAFIGADFTQAYVSCALGIGSIGYVMICFGLINAVCSLIFGSAMKFVGRCPILIMGAVIHASLIIWLINWSPTPESKVVFYVMSGLWGAGDAVWQTQVNGLYGTLFRRNKEAAFSNYRLWESFGFVVAYAYSTHLCARMKLYVLITILCVGMVGYLLVEFLHKRKAMRLKAAAENVATAMESKELPEEDDETDDIDDDIVITHL